MSSQDSNSIIVDRNLSNTQWTVKIFWWIKVI